MHYYCAVRLEIIKAFYDGIGDNIYMLSHSGVKAITRPHQRVVICVVSINLMLAITYSILV